MPPIRKLPVAILQWIFVLAIPPISDKVFYEEGHKDSLDEGEPHPEPVRDALSEWLNLGRESQTSQEVTPNILQLQILDKLHNMKRFQLLLQIPTIPAGRFQPSHGASLETLCLKVANSASTAQFIVKFSFPSLRRFIFHYISDTRFEYQPPTFLFNEIFDVLDKIRTGGITHFKFNGFQIEPTFLQGSFKRFNALAELEFIDCKITEGVLKAFT
ncbi:hypothetical protein M422DRAFT_267283 [Sphaerobolus stellatus SS14]|uniref:Uncharacterized protein n=1 Tax=Sphaerobolus stellatus (strain SS14) TaxID=990650 RepID=A0A0C9U9A2_SPHS4|nr:hypothetical protein M422DRAFT_267283 [Sphaerobolus stellatus SS14]